MLGTSQPTKSDETLKPPMPIGVEYCCSCQTTAPDCWAFALGYPRMTAMGFLMLHILFGILVGTFYTALA